MTRQRLEEIRVIIADLSIAIRDCGGDFWERAGEYVAPEWLAALKELHEEVERGMDR